MRPYGRKPTPPPSGGGAPHGTTTRVARDTTDPDVGSAPTSGGTNSGSASALVTPTVTTGSSFPRVVIRHPQHHRHHHGPHHHHTGTANTSGSLAPSVPLMERAPSDHRSAAGSINHAPRTAGGAAADRFEDDADPTMYSGVHYEDDDDDGSSTDGDNDYVEPEIADVVDELRAVADHCDVGIPDLVKQLRRDTIRQNRAVTASRVHTPSIPGHNRAFPATAASPSVPVAAAAASASTPLVVPASHQGRASAAIPVASSHSHSLSSSTEQPPAGRAASSKTSGEPSFIVGSAKDHSGLPPLGSSAVSFAPSSLKARSVHSNTARSDASPSGSSHAFPRRPRIPQALPVHFDLDVLAEAEAVSMKERSRERSLESSTHGNTDSSEASPAFNRSGRRSPSPAVNDSPTAPPQPRSHTPRSGSLGPHERSLLMEESRMSEPSKADSGDDDDEDGEGNGAGRKAVRFSDTIKSVRSYEVDNSIYIQIEYARPVIGWLFLLTAVAVSTFDGVLAHYYEASGVSPYAAYTWYALGQFAVAACVSLAYHAAVGGLSRSERRYLAKAAGWLQIGVVALVFALMQASEQAVIHMTGETRTFTFAVIHPALIAIFGMVFKNTVFIHEIVGIVFLCGGFGMAMLPADRHADLWVYAEVLALSYGIYVASFLFTCTRARARVPVPILFFAISSGFLVAQLAISGIQGNTWDANASTGVVGFTAKPNIITFAMSTCCRPFGLVGYLLALKFLPPVTVSAAIAIRPILSAFAVHVAFHVSDQDGNANRGMDSARDGRIGSSLAAARADNERNTAFWRFLSQAHNAPPASPANPNLPGIPTPAPPIHVSSDSRLFTPLFAAGGFIAVCATIYVIYISSIKRQKVDMLLKSLSKRKRPRDPYRRRSTLNGMPAMAVASFPRRSSLGSNSDEPRPSALASGHAAPSAGRYDMVADRAPAGGSGSELYRTDSPGSSARSAASRRRGSPSDPNATSLPHRPSPREARDTTSDVSRVGTINTTPDSAGGTTTTNSEEYSPRAAPYSLSATPRSPTPPPQQQRAGATDDDEYPSPQRGGGRVLPTYYDDM